VRVRPPEADVKYPRSVGARGRQGEPGPGRRVGQYEYPESVSVDSPEPSLSSPSTV
jgi:hypothetical protein